MSDLFRAEAMAHRRQRILGDILIANDRPSSILVAAISLAALGALIFAMTGEYSRTEKTPGTIVTSLPITKVLAPRSGVVTEVFVRDGQQVSQGQVLASISLDAHLDSDHASGADSVTSLDRQIALVTEQRGTVMSGATQEKARLSQQLATTIEQEVGLESQRLLQDEIIQASESMLARISQVAERGFISRFDLERRRQELLQQRQQLAQLVQQKTANRAQQQETRAQLARIDTDTARQLADLSSGSETLAQQRTLARTQAGYVVTAPLSGVVTGFNLAAGKSTIDPRIPLLSIIPQRTAFEADLFAPSRAVGFVRPGQTVRLMYDAFPYRKFGSFEGEVVDVSPVITPPAETDGSVPVAEASYRIRVKLKDQSIAAGGRNIPLQAGMALTANIVLERRSFIDWLLEPLRAVRNRT